MVCGCDLDGDRKLSVDELIDPICQVSTGCLFQSVLFQQNANFPNFCPNSTKLDSFESLIMEILLLV